MIYPKETRHKLDYATKYVLRNGKIWYFNPRGNIHWLGNAQLYKRNKQFLIIFSDRSGHLLSDYRSRIGIKLGNLNYAYLKHKEKQISADIALINTELQHKIKQKGLQSGQKLIGIEYTLEVKMHHRSDELYLELCVTSAEDAHNCMKYINTELDTDYQYLLRRIRRRSKSWAYLNKLRYFMDLVCTAVVTIEIDKLDIRDEYGTSLHVPSSKISILNIGEAYWCALPSLYNTSYFLPQPAIDITKALANFDPFTYIASKLFIPKFKPPKSRREVKSELGHSSL